MQLVELVERLADSGGGLVDVSRLVAAVKGVDEDDEEVARAVRGGSSRNRVP
jgi:hypothetical protein